MGFSASTGVAGFSATEVAAGDALSPPLSGPISPVITPTPVRLATVTDTAAIDTRGFIFAASDMIYLLSLFYVDEHSSTSTREGRQKITAKQTVTKGG
jgi:hypothetical protein